MRPPNGLRYPRVGGTRERRFAGTHFKPRKLPKNATSPTRRVHTYPGGLRDAVLGSYGVLSANAFVDHSQ